MVHLPAVSCVLKGLRFSLFIFLLFDWSVDSGGSVVFTISMYILFFQFLTITSGAVEM